MVSKINDLYVERNKIGLEIEKVKVTLDKKRADYGLFGIAWKVDKQKNVELYSYLPSENEKAKELSKMNDDILFELSTL